MNRPITAFERMVDQHGRQLTWQGKWILLHPEHGMAVDPYPVRLPATFPRSYYKVDR